MTNRAQDWWRQAERDLAQANDSAAAGRHEWACFAAHQAAEKAVEALHLSLGREAWGHVIVRLLAELPDDADVPSDVTERGRVLDGFYIPPRDPNNHPEGPPFEHFGPLHSEQALETMPTRSLDSSVLVWPDAREVGTALQVWPASWPPTTRTCFASATTARTLAATGEWVAILTL